MKIDFNDFRYLFLESLLSEDKSRLIDKLVLPDIEDEDEKLRAKAEMKDFFKKYANWENKLDWNKLKTITYSDFEAIKQQASQTRGAQRKAIESDVRNIFQSIGAREFEIVGENDNWLFVAPLTYEAAVYCDSSKNQGGSAKWCIGYEYGSGYWNQYINKGSLFIMAFNKNYKSLSTNELYTELKFMIERARNGGLNVWDQSDTRHPYLRFIKKFEVSRDEMKRMFVKVAAIFEKIKANMKKNLIVRLNKKLEDLKNMDSIEPDYFAGDEREILKAVEIPNSIKSIENHAFNNTHIEHVDIPNSVVNIHHYAFSYCFNLKSVNLPQYLKKIDYGVFAWTALESIIIPDSVKEIDDVAFVGSNLQNIVLSKNLKRIGEEAFEDCEHLRSIIIPRSVTEIGEDAFVSCSGLKTMLFKGRTMEQVRKMRNYPWGLDKPKKVIQAEL